MSDGVVRFQHWLRRPLRDKDLMFPAFQRLRISALIRTTDCKDRFDPSTNLQSHSYNCGSAKTTESAWQGCGNFWGPISYYLRISRTP